MRIHINLWEHVRVLDLVWVVSSQPNLELDLRQKLNILIDQFDMAMLREKELAYLTSPFLHLLK